MIENTLKPFSRLGQQLEKQETVLPPRNDYLRRFLKIDLKITLYTCMFYYRLFTFQVSRHILPHGIDFVSLVGGCQYVACAPSEGSRYPNAASRTSNDRSRRSNPSMSSASVIESGGAQ